MKGRSSNASSDTDEIMASGNWEHSESYWRRSHGWLRFDEVKFAGWRLDDDGFPRWVTMMTEEEWNGKSARLGFTDWLDIHCSDGKEVLKISKKIRSAKDWPGRHEDHNGDSIEEIWVVFRKRCE